MSSSSTLTEKNIFYVNEFKKSPLMQLIVSDLMSQKAMRDRLLDCIQVFSNFFQKVVMLRSALCDDLDFLAIVNEHLKEEFGHNALLDKDRNQRPLVWDPILEATSCWFAWKMLTSNEEEKAVLVHFVLETSANLFFYQAHKIMTKYKETNYFEIHSEVDKKHEMLGQSLLENISSITLSKLLIIQHQSWDMLNTTCNQIVILTAPDFFENLQLKSCR